MCLGIHPLNILKKNSSMSLCMPLFCFLLPWVISFPLLSLLGPWKYIWNLFLDFLKTQPCWKYEVFSVNIENLNHYWVVIGKIRNISPWLCGHWNSINATEFFKMDAISKYHNSEIIHGWYVCILKMFFSINIICNFLLESNLF